MKLTNLLIISCIFFSLYFWGSKENLAFSEYALLHGAYYILLTGLFVHANFLHLFGNMFFLYAFGNSLEDEVGASNMAAVFFSGGILSFLLSIPFYPGANMVGASAAIFSVMSALLLARRPGYSAQFLSPIGPIALLYLFFNIIDIANNTGGNVANISHVIGFIIGMFFGAQWNKKWRESLFFTLVLLACYIILFNYLKKYLYWI